MSYTDLMLNLPALPGRRCLLECNPPMCLACADVARVAVWAWARRSSASRGRSWVGGLEGYLVSEGLMGVQGRSEGSWVVWVLPLAGAGTEVLVVA